MSTKTLNIEQIQRLWQIKQELNGLCTVLDGLKACALNVVEELENDFLGEGIRLDSDVQPMFELMQRLITRV